MRDPAGADADLRPMRWVEDHLLLLDQTLLPGEETWLQIRSVEVLCEAIRGLRVRGAPAIGVSAAYGMCLAVREAEREGAVGERFRARLERAGEDLAATRPTAVNLFWALEKMWDEVRGALEEGLPPEDLFQRLLLRARALHEDDLERGRAMGEHGASLMGEGSTVLTHCNTGALATGGFGTALGVIRTARRQGKVDFVYATETRPLLQGARLTTWELDRLGIPHALIVDSAAAHTMAARGVDTVIVGADRIAASGDAANKIGTYALALAARHHGIPFYVAAPLSTVDPSAAGGEGIPIEERPAEEILGSSVGRGKAPEGTEVYTPAFDVTPADLITGIITERGVVSPVSREGIARQIQEIPEA
ncbi:MAG: S-methyl-5-thioribose-1-phosphate isomerase [bacterium]